jgi:hypothetical protein
MIESCWGGTSIESWSPANNGSNFNGMIAPLQKSPIRGVIWCAFVPSVCPPFGVGHSTRSISTHVRLAGMARRHLHQRTPTDHIHCALPPTDRPRGSQCWKTKPVCRSDAWYDRELAGRLAESCPVQELYLHLAPVVRLYVRRRCTCAAVVAARCCGSVVNAAQRGNDRGARPVCPPPTHPTVSPCQQHSITTSHELHLLFGPTRCVRIPS